MSELKPYIGPHPTDHTLTEYYLKAEADEVIADLKESHKQDVEQLLIEIVGLEKQVHDYAQGLYMIQARAEKELRHQKHKRCLAMAKWCRTRACYYDTFRENSLYWGWKSDIAYKWYKRWRELAEKFKPNKEADDGND